MCAGRLSFGPQHFFSCNTHHTNFNAMYAIFVYYLSTPNFYSLHKQILLCAHANVDYLSFQAFYWIFAIAFIAIDVCQHIRVKRSLLLLLLLKLFLSLDGGLYVHVCDGIVSTIMWKRYLIIVFRNPLDSCSLFFCLSVFFVMQLQLPHLSWV